MKLIAILHHVLLRTIIFASLTWTWMHTRKPLSLCFITIVSFYTYLKCTKGGLLVKIRYSIWKLIFWLSLIELWFTTWSIPRVWELASLWRITNKMVQRCPPDPWSSHGHSNSERLGEQKGFLTHTWCGSHTTSTNWLTPHGWLCSVTQLANVTLVYLIWYIKPS